MVNRFRIASLIAFFVLLLATATVALLFGIKESSKSNNANSNAEGNKKLSRMTEGECIYFVEESGIEISSDLDNEELGKDLKETITQTEDAIEAKEAYSVILQRNAISYTVASEFFTEVKKLVMDYYNYE